MTDALTLCRRARRQDRLYLAADAALRTFVPRQASACRRAALRARALRKWRAYRRPRDTPWEGTADG